MDLASIKLNNQLYKIAQVGYTNGNYLRQLRQFTKLVLFLITASAPVARSSQKEQEFVRPRWPYDMRPSARAEKYMCVIVIR